MLLSLSTLLLSKLFILELVAVSSFILQDSFALADAVVVVADADDADDAAGVAELILLSLFILFKASNTLIALCDMLFFFF